jgi:UDP-N-acetylglucosamine:LPS N-acetylglucosamine transferase
MTRRFFKIRAKNAFVKSLEARGITPTVKLDYQMSGYRGQGPTKTVYTVDWSGPARKNPTKKQKREKSRKASVQRRVAVALAKFLKQANPAMKTAGATVTRLKGGGFTIRPIKAVKRGRR